MHKSWTSRSQNNYKGLEQLKDSIKPPTEIEVVKPQALDQSKRVDRQNSISQPIEYSTFSKVRLFLSLHKDHITHKGARFQTSEECLPNQFLQPEKSLLQSFTTKIAWMGCKSVSFQYDTVSFLFVFYFLPSTPLIIHLLVHRHRLP